MKRASRRALPDRCIDLVFGAVYTALLCICVVCHDNPFHPIGRWKLLLTALLCALGIAAVSFLWHRFAAVPHGGWRAAGAVLLLYGILLIAFGLAMQVQFRKTWDFPLVAESARALVEEGTPPDMTYFALFSNNAPLLWLYVGLFSLLHLFGVRALMSGLVVFNCLCILLALWFLYLAARRLFEERQALLTLCIALACPAFLLYAPIAYTDTLTLPFTAGAVWLWLKARDHLDAGEAKKACISFAGAYMLIGAGAVLKVSVAILAVAMTLWFLFHAFRRWRLWVICLSAFTLFYVGGSAACRSALPESGIEPIPYTHWIMMGLHDRGGYYDPDYQATLALPTEEARRAFNREEILRRLSAMGAGGFAGHCVQKLSYIFSDGTFYAPAKLDSGPKTPNALHEWIVSSGKHARFLYFGADALQLCMLALCAAGAFLDVRGRERDRLTVLRLALLGLIAFLLLWEARSRYLVNFLPLQLLCASHGLQSLSRLFFNRKRRQP